TGCWTTPALTTDDWMAPSACNVLNTHRAWSRGSSSANAERSVTNRTSPPLDAAPFATAAPEQGHRWPCTCSGAASPSDVERSPLGARQRGGPRLGDATALDAVHDHPGHDRRLGRRQVDATAGGPGPHPVAGHGL